MPKMSKKAFGELLAQLGETQDEQAAALGVHRRSIIRWMKHGDDVPAVARRLAWMLVKHGRPKEEVRGW